jgi:hypothetical protein
MITRLIIPLLVAHLPTEPSSVHLSDYAPCGVTSLYAVFQIHGIEMPFAELRAQVGTAAADGTHSFAELTQAAQKYGLYGVGIRTNRAGLLKVPLPAIIQTPTHFSGANQAHLAVVVSADAEGVQLLDAPHKPMSLKWESFEPLWSGNLLTFVRSNDAAEQLRGEHRDWSWLGWCIGGVALTGCLYYLRRWWHSKRQLYILVGLLGLGLVVLVVWWLWPQPAQCFFPQPVLELGTLSPGDHTVQVPICNAGDRALTLTEVASSCSCAVSQFPSTLAGREHGALTVRLAVRPGFGSARLTVANDGRTGPQEVLLRWDSPTTATLVPRLIVGQQQPLDRPYERRVQVTLPGSVTTTHLTAVRCVSPEPLIQVELAPDTLAAAALADPLRASPRERALLVRVQPPQQAQQVQAVCELFLHFGEQVQTLKLLVEVDFVAQVRPELDAVVLRAQAEPRTLTILHWDPKQPPHLENVPTWLTATVNEGKLALHIPQPLTEELFQHTLWLVSGPTSAERAPLRIQALRAKCP